jgi:hypothetical protein
MARVLFVNILKIKAMRDQIIEITNQSSILSTFGSRSDRREIISDRDGSFWMRIYPPISDMKEQLPGNRQLCPWAMAAELTDRSTPRDRKQLIIEAFRNGQKNMRLYGLPSHRIMFVEEAQGQRITVWVD